MLFGPVPELDLNTELPEGLRAAVRQAMARKAADRYEFAELGEALQAVQRDHGPAVTQPVAVLVPEVPPEPELSPDLTGRG